MDKNLTAPSGLLDQFLAHMMNQMAESITARVIEAMRNNQEGQLQEKFLTTAEVAKLFGVTPVTISTWIGKGILTKHSMGGRNKFKYSEVMESLKTHKKYKVQ